MASSFDALPPEIVQKCVEFLDFDFVSGELKGVWSDDWEDRTKASAFIAEIARIWNASLSEDVQYAY